MADVVLVGLPGSGKSTAGRALAGALELAFIDTDEVFLEREGVTVQEYLRMRGEDEFRQREFHALEHAVGGDGVVATGGGVIVTEASRRLLSAQLTLWLDSPDDVLVSRVSGGDRPLLGDEPRERLAQLRARREGFYGEVSRARLDTSGSLDEVLAALVRIVSTTRAPS